MARLFPPLLLSALAIFASAAVAQTIDVVVYADDAYPPYSYLEKGEVNGIYTAVLRKAFLQLPGYRVQIQPIPWKRGLALLEKGDGFALYPPYFHPQERPYMKYSVPILAESVVVFCTESITAHVERKRWPEDYYGLRIGINAGYLLGGEKFAQAVKEGKIMLEQAKGNRENLSKLLNERIDCYMNDRYSIQWELKRIKAEGLYRDGARVVETGIVSAEQGYLGYTDRDNGKFPFKADFIKQLNTVIENMRRAGEVQRIVEDILQK